MILLENIGKKEVASAMVFNENNIAKRNKKNGTFGKLEKTSISH